MITFSSTAEAVCVGDSKVYASPLSAIHVPPTAYSASSLGYLMKLSNLT